MKKLVVLTGAGISQESGLSTCRHGQPHITLLRARFLLVIWFSLVAFSQLLAQPRQDDVVYLNNGTFLRGTVIDLVPEKTVKILLNGKDTLEISMFEVKEIRKENTPERLHYEDGNKAWGFTNITELVFGFGYSEGINEAVNPAQQQGMVGLSMFNGVTITPYIQLGLGTGLEFWRNRGFLPIYLDLRTNLLKSTETPLFYVSAGYSAGWMTGEEGLGLGGAMAGIGAGAKFRINRLTMVASLGYRFQQVRQWQVVNKVQSKATIDSHFLVLKTGVFF